MANEYYFGDVRRQIKESKEAFSVLTKRLPTGWQVQTDRDFLLVRKFKRFVLLHKTTRDLLNTNKKLMDEISKGGAHLG